MVGPLFLVFAVLSASGTCDRIPGFKSPVHIQVKTIDNRLGDLNKQRVNLTDTVTNLSRILHGLKSEKPAPKGMMSCQDDWVGHGNSCYLFIGTKKKWEQAGQVCAAKGATLAAVETSEENRFIRGYLEGFADLGADMSAYIGGNDLEVDGIWKWSPSGERMNFTDWYPGQPNPNHLSNGDCLIIWKKHAYHWGDIGCTYPGNFICEKPKATGTVIG